MLAAIRGIFKGSEPSGKNYMIVRQAAHYEHTGKTEPIYVHSMNHALERGFFEQHYSIDLGDYEPVKKRIDAALDDYLSRSSIEERNIVIVMRGFYVGRFIIQTNKNPATLIFHVRRPSGLP